MNLEDFRSYCLAKPDTAESLPFDADSLVFKVGGKMFALASMENQPLSVNLKCDPEKALALREQYEAVRPGYHMSKKHWNTITLDGSMPLREVLGLIDHSYQLVVAGLPKALRQTIQQQIDPSL